MIALSFIATCSLFGSVETVSFEGHKDWVFQGKIIVPENPTGPAVLMIGGGIGNDLNWGVPGSLEFNGEDRQITITGDDHDDATILADALVLQGCTVMHYSTVSQDDPKCNLYPYEISFAKPQEVMELSRAAYDAFVKHPAVKGKPIVLLGFSMGAQRVVQLAKEHEEVTSLVLLSGAQMTATSKDDIGRNVHYQASAAIVNPEVEIYDFDGDGVVRLWEVSGVLALQARKEAGIEHLPLKDKHGMPFGETILDSLKKPTLAIYGTLDDFQSCHAVVLSELGTQRPWLEIKVVPDVGHQLGPEQDEKIGPIQKSICEMIARWVTAN